MTSEDIRAALDLAEGLPGLPRLLGEMLAELTGEPFNHREAEAPRFPKGASDVTGEEIKAARLRLGLTQAEMAERLHLTPNYITGHVDIRVLDSTIKVEFNEDEAAQIQAICVRAWERNQAALANAILTNTPSVPVLAPPSENIYTKFTEVADDHSY